MQNGASKFKDFMDYLAQNRAAAPEAQQPTFKHLQELEQEWLQIFKKLVEKGFFISERVSFSDSTTVVEESERIKKANKKLINIDDFLKDLKEKPPEEALFVPTQELQ